MFETSPYWLAPSFSNPYITTRTHWSSDQSSTPCTKHKHMPARIQSSANQDGYWISWLEKDKKVRVKYASTTTTNTWWLSVPLRRNPTIESCASILGKNCKRRSTDTPYSVHGAFEFTWAKCTNPRTRHPSIQPNHVADACVTPSGCTFLITRYVQRALLTTQNSKTKDMH